MPNKIDIVSGAYQLLRISGLTTRAIPEEIEIATNVLDDLSAEISATLNLGYIQPDEYGQSDPNDYSGLTVELAGPMKKLLALELVTYFGKEAPMSLVNNAGAGMRSLEQTLVNVDQSQNPATLPIGSGNEWDYRSDKFYSENTNDDGATNHYKGEVTQLPIDWSSWLDDNTLDSVTYEAASGLTLTNEAIVDDASVVTITFTQVGQFTLCVTATKSDGEVKKERFVYNAADCKTNDVYYP